MEIDKLVEYLVLKGYGITESNDMAIEMLGKVKDEQGVDRYLCGIQDHPTNKIDKTKKEIKIRLDVDLVDKIDNLSKELGLTRSSFIRMVLFRV